MRGFLILAALVAASQAGASDPGQPLDCSDWVFESPGLSCSVFAYYDNQSPWLYSTGSNVAIDNQGRAITLRETATELEIWTYDGVTQLRIAWIDKSRISPAGSDWIRFRTASTDVDTSNYLDRVLTFDPIYGRLLIPLASGCGGNCPCGSYCYGTDYGGRWIASIGGFATTLEVFQSYEPTSLGFTVPTIPEGFPAADSFDTYHGDLATLGDFSQAQPLQCDYPASIPQTGDYLTVPDTTPTPAPGDGFYFVTAVNYQGQRRYGRQSVGGLLSGRDPALLPACATP